MQTMIPMKIEGYSHKASLEIIVEAIMTETGGYEEGAVSIVDYWPLKDVWLKKDVEDEGSKI